MKRRFLPSLILTVAVLAGLSARAEPPPGKPSMKALPNLGRHGFRITTTSPVAQRCFNRGLVLAYGFGHYAAEQEFRAALAADPRCAMAWWGIALVNGPHINFSVVPPDHAKTAWEALAKARGLAPGGTRLERGLIDALSARYANPQPEDRAALDVAYAAAMQALLPAFPQNAEVATLAAEAAMDVHPWDLWKPDGSPQSWTPEIVRALERALRIDSSHPGANHLLIHALEASRHPERALGAANRLRGLVPDASHLVHMPAHIYARVGRWKDAAQVNRDAVQADGRYLAAYPDPGAYAIYMAHNTHFLAYAAMMQGRSAETIGMARALLGAMSGDLPPDLIPLVDGFMNFTAEALMRFGRWEELLAEPEPKPEFVLAVAMRRFTRAVALTALGRTDEAKAEQQRFTAAAAAVPKDSKFGLNDSADLLAIAARVLEGEMAAKAKNYDAAITALREAVALEDRLRYDEPPDWMQPVRHTLGAVLLRAGKAREAEKVFRADLERYPENGWSLLGLRDALSKQGRIILARLAARRFERAWSTADVKPTAACYCQAE